MQRFERPKVATSCPSEQPYVNNCRYFEDAQLRERGNVAPRFKIQGPSGRSRYCRRNLTLEDAQAAQGRPIPTVFNFGAISMIFISTCSLYIHMWLRARTKGRTRML
ncbi:hypothetical protein CIHG_03206 [Coccidioides immitis H538.4]|uniref:Uncharacterized protein n=1 Tax=Coccidioides immitis H538.4 TaxID=396776 RepID=A0A0J8RN56_COCIT|nr:hypothetical protein CIHG_03206 [Coccidioides immitis H538.4]